MALKILNMVDGKNRYEAIYWKAKKWTLGIGKIIGKYTKTQWPAGFHKFGGMIRLKKSIEGWRNMGWIFRVGRYCIQYCNKYYNLEIKGKK